MSQVKVSEKVQEAIFNQIQQNPINNECADCHNKSPTWVSLDFGVFLCIRCSGVHRQLGPHITRVRSTRLDGWTKENIEIMSIVGNKVGNEFYEHGMPTGFRRPNTNTSAEDCRRFIDQKYIKKSWAPSGYKDPVKEHLESKVKGTKPNFGYIKSQNSQQEEHHEPRQPHQRETQNVRKKSMSLDKLPSDSHANQQYHDLLNDDLLSGGNSTNAGVVDSNAQTQSTSPPVRKINFANFKKAGNTATSQETVSQQAQNQSQAQNQQQQQNGQWALDLMGTNGQNNNNNGSNNGQTNNNNGGTANQVQKPEANLDVMNLYKQQTHPLSHQNHFVQGGSHHHSWSANAGGWGHNNSNNNNMYGNGFPNGHMNNNGFGSNMSQPTNYGANPGFNNPNMGYNQQNMNGGGNFGMGTPNTGYGQPQMNAQFNGNNLNSLYQNNTGFAQQQAGNRFF